MAKITLKGNPAQTNGDLPSLGAKAPEFTLIATDLSEKSLGDFAGKKKILTINPSYDTPVCQIAAKTFHQKAAAIPGLIALVISPDLPFAQKRYCGAEGIEDAVTLSTFRSSFLKDYGVEIQNGPFKGLAARAVLVLDENNKVIYRELVPEIAQEPNYAAALASVS